MGGESLGDEVRAARCQAQARPYAAKSSATTTLTYLLKDAIDVCAEVEPRRLRLRLPLLLDDFLGIGGGGGGDVLLGGRCLFGRGGHDCVIVWLVGLRRTLFRV